MEELIELLDKVDRILREKLKTSCYASLAERNGLKEARELVQKTLTVLLNIH